MTEIEWIDIFGDNLVEILDDVKMTQTELAELADVGEATISRIINKRTMPSLRTIINIADVLSMSIDELVDFGDRID